MTKPYPYSNKNYKRGFSLNQYAYFRNPNSLWVYHKTLNYLENYLERQQAIHAGYSDAYFLNTSGIITECTTANIFLLYNGELITSPVYTGLLPGVMRAKLLMKSGELGIPVREIPINKEILMNAEAVFVTNALLGAMPVYKIYDKYYPLNPSFTKQLNSVLGR